MYLNAMHDSAAPLTPARYSTTEENITFYFAVNSKEFKNWTETSHSAVCELDLDNDLLLLSCDI